VALAIWFFNTSSMAYIKNNLLSLIILLMMAVFFFMFSRGCFQPKQQALPPIIITHSDTGSREIKSDNPQQTQPIIIATQPPQQTQVNTIREIIYKNDTAVIRELLEKYYSKNSYKDVLKIDTIGTVTISDTISQNAITGRSFTYNLKYPVITNTVTIKEQYQPRNQWYYGFSVGANKADLINAFKGGFAIKNKKDQMFILNGTIHKNSGLGIEAGFMRKF
jgi:hypothetical protein